MTDSRLNTYPSNSKSLAPAPLSGNTSKSKSAARYIWIIASVAIVEALVFGGFWAIQNWTKVPVSGVVYTQNNQPLPEALVSIGDSRTYTDEEGRYKLAGLDYGSHTLAVEVDGYRPLEQIVDLELRTGAREDLTMEEDIFGILQGNVRISGDDTIGFDAVTVKVNGEVAALDSEGGFESPRLEVGQARITIEAPEINEYTELVEINKGTNDIGEVVLGIEQTKTVQIKDWYSGEPLEEASVTIDQERFVTNAEGVADIGAVNSQGMSELELRKLGYASKTVSSDNNKLFDFVLPMEGELYYTSEVDGVSRVYVSNLDGSNSQPLSRPDVWVTGVHVSEEELYYTGWDEAGRRDSFDEEIESVFKIDLLTNEESRVLQMNGVSQIENGLERQLPLLNRQQVVTLQQTVDKISVFVRGFEEAENKPVMTIDRGEGTLVNIADSRISPDGRFLAVLKQVQIGESLQNSIRLVSINGDSINQQIIFDDGSLSIDGMIGFSEDSQQLIFETSEDGNQVVQLYTIGENVSQEVRDLGINRYKTHIQGDLLYYVSGKELQSLNIRNLEQVTVLEEEFDVSNFALYGNQGILLESGGKLYYWDQEQKGAPKLVLASTNFVFIR